ncbi:MAG: 1,4-dihydroxy-2-naphthoate polyprenyltransferase [Candidatus Hydrogenedentes bacterium]|nr:1,4-dihydroxy-2-naphthoate polyprenyltransferase [Candidatus Hydrogenedentota bacterium]
MPRPSLSIWLLAARPKTLAAGIAPVIIGTAMALADRRFHALSAFCALAGAILIQIGTNFANDYFDAAKGSDTEERIGPMRVVQAGLISPGAMRLATALVFLAACTPGLYLVQRGGWPFVAIGLVSILCGVLYTGGPSPLGYLGLGDFFVLVFFGPIAVGGTYYVQALALPPEVAIAGIAPGLFSVAILTVNNLRDIEQDRQAGKRTLPVRFGRTFARIEYAVALIVAGAVVPLLLAWLTGRWGVVASILALAAAVPTIRDVFTKTDGPSLNAALARTGQLLLLFAILFSVGWVLWMPR